ncbi:uncharacterized protein LOC141588246 [Silene latifolia]|uniref:uncharacterized protein LOC141588246 n=1 Tax=Silene latifolia TaxID=37657 RepID=UPI003D782EE2
MPSSGVSEPDSTALGYKWLQPHDAVCEWYPWSLNAWAVPKHGFISWLVGHNRLLTQDRLLGMKIIQSNCCYLCGIQQETHTHLFFKCVYSRRSCKLVSDWYAEPLPDEDCINWWCRKRYRNLSKKKTVGAILAGLIYHIWMARNKCRIDQVLLRPEKLVQLVKQDVRNRLKKFQIKCKSVSVLNWIETIVKS